MVLANFDVLMMLPSIAKRATVLHEPSKKLRDGRRVDAVSKVPVTATTALVDGTVPVWAFTSKRATLTVHSLCVDEEQIWIEARL